MARAIKAPPNTDAPVVDPQTLRAMREWYAWFSDLHATLINRIPVTGSVTFAAATTAAVTFTTPEAAATYDVWFASPEDNYFWAVSKTVNGFTATAKNSSSATVRWQIIRA